MATNQRFNVLTFSSFFFVVSASFLLETVRPHFPPLKETDGAVKKRKGEYMGKV